MGVGVMFACGVSQKCPEYRGGGCMCEWCLWLAYWESVLSSFTP